MLLVAKDTESEPTGRVSFAGSGTQDRLSRIGKFSILVESFRFEQAASDVAEKRKR